MISRALFLPMLFATFFCSGENALAQGGIDVRERFDIQFGFGDLAKSPDVMPYRPMLERAMTAELHFVKKLCDPNPEQFDELHRVASSAALSIAKTYAENKRRRTKMDAWPDPNEAIARQLAEAVRRLMPAVLADTYEAEIAGRFVAHRAASAALLVNLIDQQTMLSPDQQTDLFATLRDHWQPQWSTANVLLTYPQYATLPEPGVIRPHLTELQQRLWSYRPTQRRITVSWQNHFGVNNALAAIGLEEFDKSPVLRSKSQDPERAKP
jgi:hypothetical protein